MLHTCIYIYIYTHECHTDQQSFLVFLKSNLKRVEHLKWDCTKMSFCLYNFLSVHGGMLEVTKGRTLPPWTRRQLAIHHLRGCAPKISLSSSKLWSNNLLLGARSFVMFKVSMSFYLQENHLVCNAMSFTLCCVWHMIFGPENE